MHPLCKICNKETSFFDKATILDKYEVTYYSCSNCGFIQTETPYWLPEAYSDVITSSDIGLCSRNVTLSNTCDVLFKFIFKRENDYIDYGGGYGMFTRLMRDKGFDFEWYDEYCTNIFAKGHEMKKNHYDVLTSFEMFEHLEKPMETISKLFTLANSIVFSTELIPSGTPKIIDWWYFGTDHGQHIAFYTEKCLRIIADNYNKNYYHFGNLHVITNLKISKTKCFILSHKKTQALLSVLLRKKRSLLADDYSKITGKQI